jgi:hypothetical protein
MNHKKKPSALQLPIIEAAGSNIGLNTAIIKDFCGFPQPLQANAEILPQIRPGPLTSTFIQILYSTPYNLCYSMYRLSKKVK